MDPTSSRFINADYKINYNGKFLSNNVWAYCRNTPPLSIDVHGTEDENLQELYDILNEKIEGGLEQYLFDESQYSAHYSEYTLVMDNDAEKTLKELSGGFIVDELYNVLSSVSMTNPTIGTLFRVTLNTNDALSAKVYEAQNPSYQPSAKYKVQQVTFTQKPRFLAISTSIYTYTYIKRIDNKGTHEAIVRDITSIASRAIHVRNVLYEIISKF